MKPHVLVLEDNFIISMDFAGLVTEDLHAIPVLASSVASALKLIPDDIDLAFLDIDVVDGLSYPVAKKLKENEIPFIFISGRNRDLLPVEFRESPFISKPASAHKMVQLAKSLTGAFG
jgi:CheY-like chemotaxis protein